MMLHSVLFVSIMGNLITAALLMAWRKNKEKDQLLSVCDRDASLSHTDALTVTIRRHLHRADLALQRNQRYVKEGSRAESAARWMIEDTTTELMTALQATRLESELQQSS